MLWALATLGYRPDDAFLAACHARALARPDKLSPPQLLQLTWALGVFGWRPPAGAADALFERGKGVLDTPRASLQRMRWAERAAETQAMAAAADVGAAAAVRAGARRLQ
jgi:hypothetical protein